MAEVAKRLGNTPAICRRCYIHPAIIEAFLAGDGLPRDEKAVTSFLAKRLAKAA